MMPLTLCFVLRIVLGIWVFFFCGSRGGDKRSYPVSEVGGSGREELPHAHTPKARGGGQEDQPHVQGAVAAWAQEGLEKLSQVEGQEGRR